MRPLSDFEFLNWLGNLRETIVIIAMISFAGPSVVRSTNSVLGLVCDVNADRQLSDPFPSSSNHFKLLRNFQQNY